jgi:hypothetical protein
MFPMTVSVDHWTYERYRELPDDGNRYEVLEGLLLEGETYLVEASLGPEDTFELIDYTVTLNMVDIFRGIPVE